MTHMREKNESHVELSLQHFNGRLMRNALPSGVVSEGWGVTRMTPYGVDPEY